jgi:hypothetical protein
MTSRHSKRSFLMGLATIALFAPSQGMADYAGFLVDHGVAVYYAVIPAEIIRGHEKQHPEATMHGGAPRSQNAYHLMVALFEAASKRRITDAKVTAKVTEVGLAGEEKKLEPFTVAGALTYGNYFMMTPNTNYRISVSAKRPSSSEEAHIEFPFKLEQ